MKSHGITGLYKGLAISTWGGGMFVGIRMATFEMIKQNKSKIL